MYTYQHLGKFHLTLLLCVAASVVTNATPRHSTLLPGDKAYIIKAAPNYHDLVANEEERTRPSCSLGPVGGSGGRHFSDEEAYLKNGKISGVGVRVGDHVDSIIFRYGMSWGRHHGGRGGELYYEDIKDEFITAVFGTHGDVLNSLGFHTSKGRNLGPWGGTQGSPFFVELNQDCGLAYIEGKSGTFVDRLLFAFFCQ